MEKITIELDEEEIEIVEELLNSGGFDSPTIEDAIMCGILQQITEATTEEK